MQPWQDKELEETRKKYYEFAKAELAGEWRERDANREFSVERWQKCCDAGVLGLSVPEEFGGAGKPYGHSIAAIEGMCEACRDSGFFFAMSSQISGIQLALLSTASEELKKKYLPALIGGEHKACLGFSEESAGSDIYSCETRAEKVDGGYKLNGSKAFTTRPRASCSQKRPTSDRLSTSPASWSTWTGTAFRTASHTINRHCEPVPWDDWTSKMYSCRPVTLSVG